MKPIAVFTGWQPMFDMTVGAFPLFTIHGGESDGSTVSMGILRELGIDVPDYPPYLEEK